LAGHATAHANQHALGFQVLDAAQVAEYFFLRPLPHRAGVEQNQICFVHILRRFIALSGMHDIGHLVRVVLVHLTTESFDKDFFAHAASTEMRISRQSKARPVGAKVQRFMVYVQRLNKKKARGLTRWDCRRILKRSFFFLQEQYDPAM
jgi:hypothetical protein